MLEIKDITALVDDGKPHERAKRVSKIAIHRVGLDLYNHINLGPTAQDICAHFTGRNGVFPEVAKATGGEVPYTFIVGGGSDTYDGVIWQCLPVMDVGRHARRWNEEAIGVACIGDFRVKPPTRAQVHAVTDLCVELCLSLGIGPEEIWGHMELPNASADRDKECPGMFFDVERLRDDVWACIKRDALARLDSAGLVQ